MALIQITTKLNTSNNRETSMAKVLVLYYSAYGHIEKMAYAVAEGAKSAGADVVVKRVPELVSDEVAKASYYKMDQEAPIATAEELADYDAIIVGSGTRFGTVTSQMRNFWDQTGALWFGGKLVGKLGSAFTSSATQHGGQESTILAVFPYVCESPTATMSALLGTFLFRKPQLSKAASELCDGTAPKISSCTTSSLTKSAGFRINLAADSARSNPMLTATRKRAKFPRMFFSFVIQAFFLCPRSIELKLRPPIALFSKRRLILLFEQIISDHQIVHFGSHETPIGVFGCANDGLTTHVEACINDHSITRLFLELVDEFPIARVGVAAHALDAR